MFDVKFSPKFARMRELYKSLLADNKGMDVNVLASHLSQLRLSDDRLFISLVFYTRQELWKDDCSLYRALNIPSFSLLPQYFLQLMEHLGLQRFYEQISQLPVAVGNHILNVIIEGGASDLAKETILEIIAQSLLDNSSCNEFSSGESLVDNNPCDDLSRSESLLDNSSCNGLSSGESLVDNSSYNGLSRVQLMATLIKLGRLSLARLLDSVGWLSDEETECEDGEVQARFIHHIVDKSRHKPLTSCQGCAHEDESDTDRQDIFKYTKDLVAKQHGWCAGAQWESLFSNLIGPLDQAIKDADISQICQSHSEIMRRMKGYQLVFSEDGSFKTRFQGLRDKLKEASNQFILSDIFTSFVIHQALDFQHCGLYLSYIASNILSLLCRESTRSLLLTRKAELRWSQSQTKDLLENLKSACKQEISAETRGSLEQLVLEALYGLPTSAPLLQYSHLSQFSPCFNTTPSASLANLALNKVKPQSLDEQASCKILTVMLSLNPKDVLKLFTVQILRSRSQLAVVMSKVYLFVMRASMLPVNVYNEQMKELSLSQDQVDDVLSKCLLFLPQFPCPVSSCISDTCMERFNLENSYLPEMMKNLHSCLDTANAPDTFDDGTLSALGLFSLSAIDLQLMTDSKEKAGVAKLALRLLSSPFIIRSLSGVKAVVVEVIHSLHPNTLKHLMREESLRELFIT